ncbi:MAG: sulfatase-like hydrolase/transferase [Planctomycetota bacterium]|nr:sulfatase-like hydrolase/transferase [Planctomycetota bacterium]
MRALLLVCFASLLSAQEDAPRPNIILFVADDLGYADLSLHGSDQVATPHIDTLAAGGLRCSRAYAASAICGPSRAGLLTGCYPQRFGFESNVYKSRPNLPRGQFQFQGLPARVQTLPESLRAAGYHTALVGKWHLGWGEAAHPMEHGFDHFHGFLAGSRAYWPKPEAKPDEALQIDGELVAEEFTYLTDELGAVAARYVSASKKDEPFFLVLAFSAVHGPMQAPEERLAAHAEVEPLRRRRYVAMAEAMDDAVGRVLAAIDERGIAQQTLVIFTSDHGGSEENTADNGDLRGGKGLAYEGGVRVPLFARWPGTITPGTKLDGVVSLLDLAPTALGLAGGAIPDLDGIDLGPWLRGTEASLPSRDLYWRRQGSGALLEDHWKLVLPVSGDAELYDLRADPGEASNVAAEHTERLAALSARHATWSATLRKPLWGRYKDDDE